MAVSNGYIPNTFEDQSEDKPMLILKKNGDGHGITALINRQLQGQYRKLCKKTKYMIAMYELSMQCF